MRTSRRPGATPALLIVLSIIAGCSDVISFLGLDGLFTSHITGNLVLLAAHVVAGGDARTSKLLAVPVYIAIVAATTILARRLESRGIPSLRPLLLIQLLLLIGFLVSCVTAGPNIDTGAARVILAGMVGVSAMAVQNTLVQISLEGMPATAMMTGNVTRFAIDVSEVLMGKDAARVSKARARATQTFPLIVGFGSGCALGAAFEAAFGLWALAVPTALAGLALALGFVVIPRAEDLSHAFGPAMPPATSKAD
ncbi:MAG: DUF1275 family protein [Steroidobacteraceae bacterium]